MCVCLNCGPIDQSQCWCDGVEGTGLVLDTAALRLPYVLPNTAPAGTGAICQSFI